MERDDIQQEPTAMTIRRPACLVPGCPCRDARIVSHRRARFFATRAEATGETAQRIVPADPDWILPPTA